MKLIQKPHEKDGVYEIGPDSAAEILAGAEKNRPYKNVNVSRISEALKRGGWTYNGEALIFNEHGNLIDGQHRLAACVRAQKPITSYCVFGVPAKVGVFDTIDGGIARGAADLLAMAGVGNYVACAATVRTVLAYEIYKCGRSETFMLSYGLDRRVVRLRYEKDPAGFDLSTYASRPLAMSKILNGRVAALLHYETLAVPAQRDKFMNSLLTGEGLAKNSPILKLRNRLTVERRPGEKIAATFQAAITTKAWNAFLRGKEEVGLLRWDAREKFPLIES